MVVINELLINQPTEFPDANYGSVHSKRRQLALASMVSFVGLASCGTNQDDNYSIRSADQSSLDEGATATEQADLMPKTVQGPAVNDIPLEIKQDIARNIVRAKNGCTGVLETDATGKVIGGMTAKHCMGNTDLGLPVTFYYDTSDPNIDKPYQSGNAVVVSGSNIYVEPGHDVAYFGLNGNSPLVVRQKIIDNVNSIDFGNLPINAPAIGAGFPGFNNPGRHLKFIDLAYAGTTRWKATTEEFIATIGTWIDGISCTPGISGGPLYIVTPDRGPVLVGVTYTYAQLEDVREMPYEPPYGLELLDFFEGRLGHEMVNADYLCGYATPINMSNLTSSRTQSLDGQASDVDLSWIGDIWKEEPTLETVTATAKPAPGAEVKALATGDPLVGLSILAARLLRKKRIK